jgi:hypothetical protein
LRCWLPPGSGWALPQALLRHRRMARLLLNWGNELTRSFKSARDADAVAIGIWDGASQDADPVGSSPIQTFSAVKDDQACLLALRLGDAAAQRAGCVDLRYVPASACRPASVIVSRSMLPLVWT